MAQPRQPRLHPTFRAPRPSYLHLPHQTSQRLLRNFGVFLTDVLDYGALTVVGRKCGYRQTLQAVAYDAQNKLKVQLKLSISRLRMTQQKDSAKAKQQRREMAQLLEVCRALRGDHT